MFQRIDSYISRQVLIAMAFVVVSLVAAIWLSQSLRFIDTIVNRGLPLSTFMSLTLLLLPSFLIIVLPIATFTATLFVYHRMVTESEAVVLLGTGFSPMRLARPALLVALGVTIVLYILQLWLLPVSYREFKELQVQIRNNYSSVVLREGVFTSIGNGLTVFVRERADDGSLRGLVIHNGQDQQAPETIIAEEGAIIVTPDGPRVVLVNGNRQMREADGRLSVLYFERYTVDFGGLKQELGTRFRETEERFIGDLFNPQNLPNERFRGKFLAEAHNRLASPWLAPAFVLVGLAILFFGDMNRRGKLKRLTLAAVLVLGGFGGYLGIQGLVAKQTILFPLIYAIPLIGILAGSAALIWSGRTRSVKRSPTNDDLARLKAGMPG
ncbi:MAG: LPS export ABC transporter permease LptF [Alphaproteobacteria bacterium]|nr:LPS export ABC transporter permease LptF [Alphaproteobacteria bacterium]